MVLACFFLLRFVVFDVPLLLGADLRDLPWQERRDRLELLACVSDVPLQLSPIVEPSASLVASTADPRSFAAPGTYAVTRGR